MAIYNVTYIITNILHIIVCVCIYIYYIYIYIMYIIVWRHWCESKGWQKTGGKKAQKKENPIYLAG